MGLKEDDRANLVDHLEELRTRILRSLAYVGVLTAAGWFFYDHILALMFLPVSGALDDKAGQMMYTGVMEPFWTRFQVSVVVGLVAGAPLLLWEAWGFVGPGLTRRERRGVLPLMPISLGLALAGVALCYAATFRVVPFMLRFAPPNVPPFLRLNETVMFVAKFYLAFAVAFQLPLLMAGLVRSGVISADTLARRRREAVVVILIATAILTPTPDALTLAILAVPLLALFEGTLWVLRIMERRHRREVERYDEDVEPEPE